MLSMTRKRLLQALLTSALACLSVTAVPAHAAPTPAECRALRQQATQLQSEIRELQIELSTAAPGAKSRLVAEIRRLGARLVAVKQQLQQCPNP